jgi:hypothetical protein
MDTDSFIGYCLPVLFAGILREKTTTAIVNNL